MTATTPAAVPPAAALPKQKRSGAADRFLYGTIGVVSILAVWEVLGRFVFDTRGGVVPPPSKVVSQMVDDGWAFYGPNIRYTGGNALHGWVWGNGVAIGLALVILMIPVLERPLMRLAIVSFCLPIIAVGPILTIALEEQPRIVAIVILSVLFSTLVGALQGLRSADTTSLDLVRAYGGSGWTALTKVRIRAALPSLFAGLRIAGPAAVLGAMLGEYFGAEKGLGTSMIIAEQSLNAERTWGVALTATALGGVAYAVTALVGRLLTPWAPRMER